MQLVPLMPCVHFTWCLSVQVPVRRALLKSKCQPCVLGYLRMYAVLLGLMQRWKVTQLSACNTHCLARKHLSLLSLLDIKTITIHDKGFPTILEDKKDGTEKALCSFHVPRTSLVCTEGLSCSPSAAAPAAALLHASKESSLPEETAFRY